MADISASRVSTEPTRALRVFQMSGYLSLDLAGGRGEYLKRKSGVQPGDLWGKRDPGALSLADFVERVPIQGDDAEPLRLELEAFLDGIRGRSSGSVTAAEGRAALQIALRIQSEIERSTHVPAQDP